MIDAGRALVTGGPECPNCMSTSWNVAMLGDVSDGTLDLSPAPMARCAECGLSTRLDGGRVRWEP